jgi:MFS family permease
MGGKDDGGGQSRTAIPFTAGAIVTAQLTMAIATWAGDSLTGLGVGRKPLFMAAILSLPIRCALILWFKDAGKTYLLSTQVFDGIGGGLIGLIHPYLVADITFGTGRFNVVSECMGGKASFFLSARFSVEDSYTYIFFLTLLVGLTASCFGLGATLSNFLGQMVVEHFGHVASLMGSLILSIVPILLFSTMPETYGRRGDRLEKKATEGYETFSLKV